MEFFYMRHDSIVRLYVKGLEVYADIITDDEPDTYLLCIFPFLSYAEDYMANTKREKLNEAHGEALRENASRTSTVTEYVIEAVNDNAQNGHDVATYFDDELSHARTRLEMLREKGYRVRLVKRVTTSEVID